jgi:hypothetical protein
MWGGHQNMNLFAEILVWTIFGVLIGIPLLVIFVIPSFSLFIAKKLGLPSFNDLLTEFKVDIWAEPYQGWLKKNYTIFVSLTSIELYVSWFLIKVKRWFKRK